ncbi:PLP-dependent aminotransferase family protein [Patulibacter sp. SYSU D01012]|uniref:MocR-like transcription factor YczR n=1 Tax=Patulibacter sp. SYSU D01012 TaxID=2817381 RepID=UPI001B3144F7|nr:PLP-dependent aminotransferase family protein [Patulibacter sp. SYSU D01012]
MTPRSITSAALARQLGAWRDEARGGGPAYRRLAAALRALILDGRVALDVRLPGERDLAATLGVSRTTVSAAYAELREGGHLVSRHGSGSRTAVPGDRAPRAPGALVAVTDDGSIDLGAAAMPAAAGVHGAYAAALEQLPAHLPGPGYDGLGLPALRAAIADRFARRGLPTTPDQILVTLGAQHAFSLVLQLLVGPGDRVVIDHPTYPHAIDAVARASARPVPVGLTATGWDVDGVLAALRQTGPRLAYLLPDFHNPTGHVMPPEERERIAAAAAAARTTLVVDETMIDLGLDGPPPAPFAAHDPSGDTVITLGSMSKGYWGGLRVGWIRASVPTVAALTGVRPAVDLGTPLVEQLASAELLRDDDARLAERRALLASRRDGLLAALAAHLPTWRAPRAVGGQSTWIELPDPVSSALVASAARHGVRLVPGPRFGVDGAFERFLRLPFSRPADELDEAVVRIARAYADLRPGDGGARREPAASAAALV